MRQENEDSEGRIALRTPPFLKWAGGKRWFVQKHAHLLPTSYARYIEPFLGSGSVFFYLRPNVALLGDTNPDVIAAYNGLKMNWRFIKRSLQHHQRKHSQDHYYKVRASDPSELLARASRMIYLNRTCFNGIYRVNLKGEFNVPRGNKTQVLLDSDDFEGTAKLLENASIHMGDFETLIEQAGQDDFVFADPPYTVRHNLNGFIKYNETLFSWDDQERLAKALIRARRRGAKIVCTNANHSSVRKLYKGTGLRLQTVSRFSSISAAGDSRKQFEELVILSHPNNGK